MAKVGVVCSTSPLLWAENHPGLGSQFPDFISRTVRHNGLHSKSILAPSRPDSL